MVALFTTASAAALAFAVLPAVQAHMSIWTPAMYGFNNDWNAVTPLANQPFDQWVSLDGAAPYCPLLGSIYAVPVAFTTGFTWRCRLLENDGT
jgi:hypothetical protein